MKRIVSALLFTVVALVLVACSPISTGFVTGKTNTPAYTYIQMICASYNSKGFCMTWVPNTIYVPERWKLDLQNGDQTGWVYVSEATYDGIAVGDVFNGEVTQ